MLTVEWLRREKVIEELAKAYDNRGKVHGLLGAMDVPIHDLPPWGTDPAGVWWAEVCNELERGIVEDGLGRLVQAAAGQYQSNPFFLKAASYAGKTVENRVDDKERVCQVSIKLDARLPDRDIFEHIAAIKALAHQRGFRVRIEYADVGSIDLRTAVDSRQQAEQLKDDISRSHPHVQVTITDVTHRDYWMDINAEGPDGRRFVIEGAHASTRVRDIAKGITGEYQDEFWPQGKAPIKATVDRVDASGGAQRLNPDQTLHEAGVRPHDTLRVHPEAQAGAVDPFLRYESLALVRNQIRDFARANREFRVQANSAEVATEYVFHFDAPSFAPGQIPGDAPVPIEHHEVLLMLGPDFPMEGPLAFWQHPIFHPNVAADSGVVCLGVLRESYRPGLHFGEVCQMLVDMAAYRNYVVHEGFNAEAAQWAVSPAGQAAIVARGGRSLIELYGTEVNRPIRFTVRRLDE